MARRSPHSACCAVGLEAQRWLKALKHLQETASGVHRILQRYADCDRNSITVAARFFAARYAEKEG
jgi:hypothetical protein